MVDDIEFVPSFRQIDYRVRPNKGTERRMFIETFRRLAFFEPVENYRYVGFGSTAFSDFILVHRELNITDMVSVEKHDDYRARFEFNVPFHCIHLKFGDSNQVLPELTWDKRVIVWLDYDTHLTASVIKDTNYVTLQAVSGSVFIVTVNVDGYRSFLDEPIEKLNRRLREKFEKDAGFGLPPHIKGINLQGIEMAKVCRDLIVEAIIVSLRRRNGLRPAEHSMQYYPLFNITYRDGAQMLTVGGIFFEERERPTLELCQFENLDFTQPGKGGLYEIKVPVMTPRERHYLDQRLPTGKSDEALKIGLKKEEIDSYVRLYRYCPSFAEVDLD